MVTEVKKVGFVGLGIMGKPMARNRLKAGFELKVHSRSRPPVDELAFEGATVVGGKGDRDYSAIATFIDDMAATKIRGD